MDAASQTIIENLQKNTGKTLEQWVEIVLIQNFEKHGDIIKFLKEKHAFTHAFANLVALKSRASDAELTENIEYLIEKQYQGKENLKAIYEHLIPKIMTFDDDIEITPKPYISLRRKKQFATLNLAINARFEIEINLKRLRVHPQISSRKAQCNVFA